MCVMPQLTRIVKPPPEVKITIQVEEENQLHTVGGGFVQEPSSPKLTSRRLRQWQQPQCVHLHI